MTIQELYDKRNELQSKLDDINSNENFDKEAHRSVTDELNAVVNQISQMEYEQQQRAEITAKHEVRVEQAQVKVAYLFDNLKVYGNELRDYFIDEESYQGVRIEVQKAVNDLIEQQSADFTAIEASYKLQQQADADRATALQEQYDTLFEEAAGLRRQLDQLDELKRQVHQLQLEKDDALAKRDAAVAEKEGLELLVKEKDEHITTLRTEMATSARGGARTLTPEEIQREEEAKRQAWINSRIKVTNIRWQDDLKRTHYAAELAENGETVVFGRLDKAKYLEVSAEEAARFRAESEAQGAGEPVAENSDPVQNDIPATQDVTPEAPSVEAHSFPEIPEAPAAPVAETDASVEVAGETVSRAEFEELKARVDRLEGTRKEAVA